MEPAPIPVVPKPVTEYNPPPVRPSEANDSVSSRGFAANVPDPIATFAPASSKSWVNPAIIVSALVLLLALAASAVWFYVSHVRARHIQTSAIGSSAQPLTAANSSSPSGANDKPSAATPLVIQQYVQTPPEQAQPVLPKSQSAGSVRKLQNPPASPVPVQRSNAVVPKNPAGSLQNAAPAPAPSAPTSGVLHYSGPPVPYGGTVVFINLPSERLSFTFDHQSWQPLISRQPDGTQKLTLRSLRQGEQTQCDVEWKVIK